jgi:hypothetical protein
LDSITIEEEEVRKVLVHLEGQMVVVLSQSRCKSHFSFPLILSRSHPFIPASFQQSPKPEGNIPLQTFLMQYGDKDKTSKDKNKQNTIELRVDEGAKGLNVYILKIDDGTFAKWGAAFEGLLASGTLGGGAVSPSFLFLLHSPSVSPSPRCLRC